MAPSFVNLQTFDFHETASSATVASGLVTAPALPSSDLDNKVRTVCGTVDMGTYELHPQPPISVTSSQNPSVGGTAVTFTANLTGNCNIPTGTVTFYDGATPLGTQTLSAGASASLTTAALTVGSHNITVGYPGDFNFNASTSATLVQVVTGYPTTTTLTVSPNPANAFGPITLSSTVTSSVGVPNGTVTFTAGGTVLATATLNISGQATATISSLGTGSYTIIAVYSATSNYAASSSEAVNETVVGAESITALSASPNPAVIGQNVTLQAIVKAVQGTAVPGGTVVFRDGPTQLGKAALSVAGTATFSTASLATGSHTLTATYSGSGNFNPSSASGIEVITATATTTSLTATPNPAGSVQTVTLTATVAPTASGVPVTGTVSFLDGSAVIGTATLNATGVATFSTDSLAVGMHGLAATFPGNGSLVGSTSPMVTETIVGSTFTLSLTPATVKLRAGQSGVVDVQLGSVGDYAGIIALSSGPLPAYTSGTLNAPTVTLASAGQASATLTVTTQVVTASVPHTRGRVMLASVGLFLAPLALAFRRRRFTPFLAVLFAIGLLSGLIGCGEVRYAIHAVNPGSYTIPITGTDSAGNRKTSSFTLVIAQ